jgi:hypothetical protein
MIYLFKTKLPEVLILKYGKNEESARKAVGRMDLTLVDSFQGSRLDLEILQRKLSRLFKSPGPYTDSPEIRDIIKKSVGQYDLIPHLVGRKSICDEIKKKLSTWDEKALEVVSGEIEKDNALKEYLEPHVWDSYLKKCKECVERWANSFILASIPGELDITAIPNIKVTLPHNFPEIMISFAKGKLETPYSDNMLQITGRFDILENPFKQAFSEITENTLSEDTHEYHLAKKVFLRIEELWKLRLESEKEGKEVALNPVVDFLGSFIKEEE